jgi:hypothetical protein
MPTRLISNSYSDIFSNVTSYYKSNVADKVTLTSTIETNISVTEDSMNDIKLNWIDDEIKLNGGKSWISEGFKIGDSITLNAYNPSGTIHSTRNFTIDYVDNYTIGVVGSLGVYYDDSATTLRVINTSRYYEDLEIYFNHILNDAQPTFSSLIDGELSKIMFTGINSMAVSGTLNGTLVGNKSGQYLISSVITRLADSGSYRKYEIETTFLNSGIYDSTSFDNGNCLKLALNFRMYAESGDITNIQEFQYSELANTGYFDQAYNVDTPNATLTQGIDVIAYNQETTFDIIVNTSETDFSLGCSYIPIDEDYYKNKTTSQIDLGYLLDQQILAVGTIASANGTYEIEVNSINIVGTTHTINVTFRPLTNFDTFILSKSDSDRLFRIWIKAGNINLTAFNDQITKVYDAELPLSTSLFTYIRHNDNNITSTLNVINKVNKEDDIALYSTFTLTPNKVYNGLNVSIVAYNSVTFEEFELESMYFDFSTAQISNSGQYLLNISQNITNNLPNTSNKKTAKLLNTSGTASIYYPFIVRWEDWLSQTNADVSFYPNQNKDWYTYISGDWSVKAKLTLETSETLYTEYKNLPIYDYDSEVDITSVVELYDNANNLVDGVISGQIMKVKSTHTFTNFPTECWGQITIGPFENSPRWLISSVIDTDNNVNCPLIPITGNTATITISGHDAIIECYLDTNKLNTQNVSISSKIYSGAVLDYAQFSDDEIVQFSNNNNIEWN